MPWLVIELRLFGASLRATDGYAFALLSLVSLIWLLVVLFFLKLFK